MSKEFDIEDLTFELLEEYPALYRIRMTHEPSGETVMVIHESLVQATEDAVVLLREKLK